MEAVMVCCKLQFSTIDQYYFYIGESSTYRYEATSTVSKSVAITVRPSETPTVQQRPPTVDTGLVVGVSVAAVVVVIASVVGVISIM